jgi:hypothetical protein
MPSEFIRGRVQHMPGAWGVAAAVRDAVVGSLPLPVATPEVDTRPTTAAAMRVVAVNQEPVNTFDIWVNDGTGAPVENDVVFIATGR